MKPRALIVVLAATLAGCDAPAQPGRADGTALADTLRNIIASAYDFTQPDVVDRMVALYADSGRIASASGGEIMTSQDSVRAGIADFWQTVGRNMREPRWEWGAVYVDRLGEDGAVLTGTWTIPHIAPTNQPHSISGAWTAVFVRTAAGWRIVQEHLSSTPPAPPPPAIQ